MTTDQLTRTTLGLRMLHQILCRRGVLVNGVSHHDDIIPRYVGHDGRAIGKHLTDATVILIEAVPFAELGTISTELVGDLTNTEQPLIIEDSPLNSRRIGFG